MSDHQSEFFILKPYRVISYYRDRSLLIIIIFDPEVRNFFQVFSDEIFENIVNLSDLWGDKSRNLEEKVHSARSFNEITGILDEFFLKHLLHEKNNHISESAVQIIKIQKASYLLRILPII